MASTPYELGLATQATYHRGFYAGVIYALDALEMLDLAEREEWLALITNWGWRLKPGVIDNPPSWQRVKR